MAEIKFSQLTTAAQLTNDDIFAFAQMQGGSLSSVKTSMIAVANYLNTQVQYTTAYNTQAKTTAGAINELKQLISLIPQFSIEVVEELPTEDISDTTIYLVPAEDPEVGNYYEEYIHVNDSWELVGTTAVDLSAYYTKLEVDGLLATKASVTEVALKENKTDMPTDVRTIIKDCKTPKNATITNGIAQFECIEENLVKGLKLTMNPIQDLHGYSNPWAGGAGKNKFQTTATSQTINGTDFTVNADGSVTIKNTPSATTSLYFGVEEFPAGTYKANGFSGGASNNIRLVFLDITHNVALAGIYQDRDIEFTLSETSNIRVYPIVPTQYDGNEVTMYPMIRLATETDATFAPYSNICPISGRTEASVTVNDYYDTVDLSDVTTSIQYFPVKVGEGNFTMTTNCPAGGGNTAVLFFLAGNVTSGQSSATNGVWNGQDRTATSIDGYVTVAYRKITGINPNDYVSHIYHTDKMYETHTKEFGQTVYGGSLDLTNGNMSITKKAQRFGDMDWTYHSAGGVYSAYFDAYLPDDSITGQGYVSADIITERYKSVPSANIATTGYDNGVMALASNTRRFIVCDTNFTDVTTFKTTLADVIVVYPLATPTTIETSAEEITTVSGTNIISGTEPISECKYTELATVDDLIKIIGGAE